MATAAVTASRCPLHRNRTLVQALYAGHSKDRPLGPVGQLRVDAVKQAPPYLAGGAP